MKLSHLVTTAVLVGVAGVAQANGYPINQGAFNAAQARQQYQYGNGPVANLPVTVNTPGAQANFGPAGKITYYVPPAGMEPKVVAKPQDLSPANMANRGTYTPDPKVVRVDPGHAVPAPNVLAAQQANQKLVQAAQQQQQLKAMGIAQAPINNRR